MTQDVKDYYYVVYDNEVVVFNKKGKKIISCPTEDEAIAYIRENSKEE